MADYWKSNPRKFCEFCKCWFADNKSSIDFHERGKRHKENVEKKIGELRKKGQEQYATEQDLGNFLKQMEEGAMKAFKKDVSENPNLVPEYKVALVENSIKQAQEAPTALPGTRHEPGPASSEAGGTTTAPTTMPGSQGQNEWIEGLSPEGYPYYWNTITGASQWEKPADYKPPAEKSSKSPEQSAEISGSKSPVPKEGDDSEEDKSEKKDEEKEKEKEPSRGVKRRHDAYGGWTSLATEDPEPVDLQLPEASPMYMSSFVPQAAEFEPHEMLTIKEKTVGSISSPSDGAVNVSFKKRKAGGRQIRQRDTTS